MSDIACNKTIQERINLTKYWLMYGWRGGTGYSEAVNYTRQGWSLRVGIVHGRGRYPVHAETAIHEPICSTASQEGQISHSHNFSKGGQYL